MLKPTVKKDCCHHNVSQYSALQRVRQLPGPADSSSAVAGPHAVSEPSIIGFGEAYYDRLSQLIDKHLQLATDDNVCYVGDAGGAQVVPVLAENYCLVKAVTRVNPYIVRYLLFRCVPNSHSPLYVLLDYVHVSSTP